MEIKEESLEFVLNKLRNIALRGPIRTRKSDGAPSAVGMTLLDALGIDHSSTKKPKLMDIVINGRRIKGRSGGNRVNLFAQVPNWEISSCKSSAEILRRFGYINDSRGLKLNCTVSGKRPNSQGLFLEVKGKGSRGLLHERAVVKQGFSPVVSWNIDRLTTRAIENHPASIWVAAISSNVRGVEYFHYKEAVYTGMPDTVILPELLREGIITVDHLISSDHHGLVKEKGPLFKIKPDHVDALFPIVRKFNLLS